MLVPYVATSIQLSTIVEVYPYDEELQDKIVKPAEKAMSTTVDVDENDDDAEIFDMTDAGDYDAEEEEEDEV
jgi:hypothetical protein